MVRVQRDAGQLVERVVVAFLRGGRAVREGLAGAAEAAAGEVRDWAEGCGEERRRLSDKMEKIEAAKAEVVRGLGAASAEELMAAAVCVTALWYWQRLCLQRLRKIRSLSHSLLRFHSLYPPLFLAMHTQSRWTP